MYRKHLRMARGEGEVESRQGLRSHFVERMVKLPMVHVAWDYAANTYSSIKESNRLVNFTLTNAERSVNFMAGQAKPVVLKFEKQIQVVDDLACKGLGTLEEKVPLIKKSPNQIIGDTRKLYTDKVTSTVDDVRKFGTDAVKRIADYGFHAASSILGENVVNSVIGSVDGVLAMTEKYIDHVLPPSEDEKKHDKKNSDYQNNVSEESDPKQSIVTRLARVSSAIQTRIYRITVVQVHRVRGMVMEILNVPDYLLVFAFQNLETASLYLQRLLEVLNQEQPPSPDAKDVPLKLFLPILRPTYKKLMALYNALTSRTKVDKSDSNNTTGEVSESHGVFSFVKENVLKAFGILRLLPAATVMYVFAFISRISEDKEGSRRRRAADSKSANSASKSEQNNVHTNDGIAKHAD